MDTWTEVVPWPEQPAWKAMMAWEDGAPFPATWAVHVTWADVDGVMTPIGFDFRSYTTRDGETQPTEGGLQRVTARGVRAVSVGEVIEKSRESLDARLGLIDILARAHQVLHPEDPQDMARVRAAAVRQRTKLHEGPRRGRPTEVMTDEHLQEVAQVYRQAADTGSRSPVRAVADHFEDRFPGITAPNDFRPKGWVQAARKRGLID